MEDPVVEVMIPEVVSNESRNPFSRIWSRSLRIKIIGRDGFEKLDVRIPVRLITFANVCFSELIDVSKTCLYGWSRPDSWKVSPTLYQVIVSLIRCLLVQFLLK